MDCLLYLLPLLLCFHKSKNHSNRSKCSPTFLLDHWNIIHKYRLTKFTLISVSDNRGIFKACSIKPFDRNILLFKVRFQLKHSSDIINFLVKNIWCKGVNLLVDLLWLFQFELNKWYRSLETKGTWERLVYILYLQTIFIQFNDAKLVGKEIVFRDN